jgi:methylase of polypeptide subunit release factors
LLKTISQTEARRLRDFLQEAGYEESGLRKRGFFNELPSSRLRNMPRLLDSTSERNLLNLLLRWFWIGIPYEAALATELVPPWFLTLALSCRLLRQDGDSIVPEVMLFPVEGFLVTADHTTKIDANDPELVLWPNPTTRFLSRFTVRRHSRATLDLGTGNAMQALSAAAHSDTVVATDLNPRAVNFAQFTARLNGKENIEALVGDGFAPVAGRKFDLIVSNPPFFISPSGRYMFCDNPMDLDGLCRQFVKNAPNYLEEGGYFQLLCEWAGVRGQPWRERIGEWLEGSGCDAWVIMGHTQDPAEYAQHRIAETASAGSRDDAELYSTHMAYYRERNVEAIHDGIIALRRRSGNNWTHIEEISELPNDPFGEYVQQAFSIRDFLQSHDTVEQLSGVKPRLAPYCRLEQFFQPGDGQWQPTSLNLRLLKGLPFFLGLQAPVAGFLLGCNGSKTVAELIHDFARQVDAPFEQVQKECLAIVHKLIERGFLLC